MNTPNRIQNNGIELNKPNDDLTITLTTTNGLDIEYDLNSVPKEFKLNENGVYWTNGVQTFQTSLNRLCAIEQAFQAVELPPNATTLKLNDTLLIDNGSLTTTYSIGSIDVTNVGMSIIAPNTNIYLGDVNGTNNSTTITIDDTTNKTINLTTDLGTIGAFCNTFQVGDVNGNVNSTSIKLDDANSKVEIQAKDNVKIGDYLGLDTNTNLLMDCANASTSFFSPNLFLVQTNNFQVDNQTISTIGDVNNNSSFTKFYLNASNQTIDLNLGGGNGASGMILRMGDFDNNVSGANIYLNAINPAIYLDSRNGVSQIGDINGIGTNTLFTLNDTTKQISGYTNGGTIDFSSGGGIVSIGDAGFLSNGTSVKVDDGAMKVEIGDIGNSINGLKMVVDNPNYSINVNSRGGTTTIGDVDAVGNNTKIIVNDNASVVSINCNTPVKLNQSGSVQYSTNYYTTSQSITNNSPYALTFNGAGLTATLPSVSSSNVGTQYLITNTNGGSLTVASTGGQLIYSATSPASATSRTLGSGHSQIFTAIRTTGSSTYGWSMV